MALIENSALIHRKMGTASQMPVFSPQQRSSEQDESSMKSREMVSSRKQSIVEVAEQHFDKNTIILIVNLMILTILMAILYMIATSAMAAGGRDEH